MTNLKIKHCDECNGVGGFPVQLRQGGSVHYNYCSKCDNTGHVIEETNPPTEHE